MDLIKKVMRGPERAAPERVGSTESLVGLNLIRGVAALIVYLGHVRGSSFVDFGSLPLQQQALSVKVAFAITRMGYESVLVFFVLSGYLVGGQVIRKVQEGRFNILAYGLERTTRIFIPLVPACILSVVLGYFILGQSPSYQEVIFNMVGLNGVFADTLSTNLPLWTLAYEIWFYILAGAIGYLFAERRHLAIVFSIIACCVAIFCILAPRYLLFWLLGCLGTFLISREPGRLFVAIGGALFVGGVVDYELAAKSNSFVNVVYLPVPVAEASVAIGVCLIVPLLYDPLVNLRLAF